MFLSYEERTILFMNKRNIYLLFTIEWLQGMVFYGSIATLYRQSHGLSLVEMGLIESFFSIFVFILEIPMGYIGDRFGYKKTLISCYGLYFVSKIIFYQAYSFWMFLLERILLALTVSGLSGCDSAFLYLSTGKMENPRIFGYYHACGVAGMMIASLTFSLWIQDVEKAAFLTIFPYLIAFGLSFFLNDIPVEKRGNSHHLRSLFSDLWKQKRIILFLISTAFILETTHTISVFYNQIQWKASHIPMIYFGWLAILMNFIPFCSAILGKLAQYIQEKQLMMGLISLCFLSCLVMGFYHIAWLSIAGVFILTFVEALYTPLSQSIMNHMVESHLRVTMLSIYSMIMNMVGVFTNMSFGVAGNQKIEWVMLLGALFSLVSLLCYWKHMKGEKKNGNHI